MRSEEREDAFVDEVRRMLDQSGSEVDARVRMRLRSARLRALEAAQEHVPWYVRIPRWVGAGALATVMVLIIAVTLWLSAERSALTARQVEDMELMATHEQLEMYKDLDFYRWLENNGNAG
jgi:hypothetical protein